MTQIATWRPPDLALDRLQIEQGLPGACSVDNEPERLPHPLRARHVFIGLPDLSPMSTNNGSMSRRVRQRPITGSPISHSR